ncbi:Low-density lipoprotein receptor-related protein 2 [Thelohanellus kitauei]|uniref:Low-density lipoprotein receptor-related protein 2 n=1 Tax=Thelohanellus kitauei TaxID=669202 RepID=A0A0C2MX67_THEKT|nr:Low-density lipoprotein receptor-related protein 2 [Thelohanellus kitauei]
MTYDPISRVLIYLTIKRDLKILSVVTNYQKIVSKDVTWFRYSFYHKSIYFVTSENKFCYSNLLEKPSCNPSPIAILQSIIDLKNSKAYFLTKKRVLIVKSFVKDLTNMQTLTEIHLVSNFAVFDNHLYFLAEGRLMYRNLDKINENVKLSETYHFNRMQIHRVALQSYQHACDHLNCQFMYQPTSDTEVICGCPSFTTKVDNRCECPVDRPDCLVPHCAGFQCKNAKCLLNNVLCNGVNDCNDGSDEVNCPKTCSAKSHLCKGECISNDTVCDHELEEEPKRKDVRAFYIPLIVFACLFFCSILIYLIYRFKGRQVELGSNHTMRYNVQANLCIVESTRATTDQNTAT